VSDEFLARLTNDLVHRRIKSGIEYLRTHPFPVEQFNPTHKNAAAAVGYLAQWVDAGYGTPSLVKTALKRFQEVPRVELSICDYLNLKIADAFVCMAEGQYESAVKHLKFVRLFEPELEDQQLVRVCNFWGARCLGRLGQYTDALACLRRAMASAAKANYLNLSAVMTILEGAFVFHQGKFVEAKQLLSNAEAVLLATSDDLSLGNLHYTYGRIALREGQYDQALEKFFRAIREYKKLNAKHRQTARVLVDIASAKRNILLRLNNFYSLASPASVSNKNGVSRRHLNAKKRSQHDSIERIQREAIESLRRAEGIYEHVNDHSGLASVQIMYGRLVLDRREWKRANSAAALASKLIEHTGDHALRARVKLLQSAVYRVKSEEEVRAALVPSEAGDIARDLARQAVDCAKLTQDSHLLAEAYASLGLTFCCDHMGDEEVARHAFEKATALLCPGDRDHVREEVQLLKQKIQSPLSVDSRLQAWSHGLIDEDKTFQQITEEFASIVIPKVWDKENRTISRVVQRLSISPKKVRTILRKQGLHS
jgi:tetratricopeptide (TPR) repeat protein